MGRMMAIEARRLGVHTTVLDPAANPPAAGIADVHIRGSLYDHAALDKLAASVDVVSFEIEHTDADYLATLEQGGKKIFPKPATLLTIQDKLLQKQFLAKHDLPVPSFRALARSEIKNFTSEVYPVVHKARAGGYDGKGVSVIRSCDNHDQLLDVDGMIEEYIDLKLELAVLLARGTAGQISVWPLIEMVFDERTQICSRVCAPARVSEAIAKQAVQMSVAAIEALDGVGVFAVELFITQDDRVLINEIAPRPHNSGHWTIEGAVCNQFEQHVRAVCGFPLGDARLLRPSVMVNLLGAEGAQGSPIMVGADQLLAIPGLRLHWYQKETVAPMRKMGHFTITHDDLEKALVLARKAEYLVSIEAR